MTRSQELHEQPLNTRYDPEWYALWRELVGGDLLGGYATLQFPRRGEGTDGDEG